VEWKCELERMTILFSTQRAGKIEISGEKEGKGKESSYEMERAADREKKDVTGNLAADCMRTSSCKAHLFLSLLLCFLLLLAWSRRGRILLGVGYRGELGN